MVCLGKPHATRGCLATIPADEVANGYVQYNDSGVTQPVWRVATRDWELNKPQLKSELWSIWAAIAAYDALKPRRIRSAGAVLCWCPLGSGRCTRLS